MDIGDIKVYTQSSIRIKSEERIIYVDPFQMKEEPRDADLIFVTHDHYDHFSPEDIQKTACDKTTLVVPEKMAGKAREVAHLVKEIVTVTPDSHAEICGMEVDTVASYNIMRPFHPKSAGWVGYILNIDGKRVYIAGDSDATKEAKAVKCDIALIPIGGTYTMDAKKAAELVNTIRPSLVIPTHYGSIVGKPGDAEVFKKNVDDGIRVEVMI